MSKQIKILGISAFYHDSAAAILVDGEIVAAAQEERFTRKKHDDSFPANAIKFCLDYAGTKLNDLDAIVFYDKPLLKFERLLETYYAFAPKGVRSFITAMPVWLKEKVFLKRLLSKELKKTGDPDSSKVKYLFPEHHLSHAASAYYASGYNEAAILTIDGVGEWATASIAHGQGKDITILRELHFPHSVGLLYSAFTYFLGFKVNSGEYKLMGLAPYGDAAVPDVARYIDIIKTKLVTIKDDGSIWVNQEYFTYAAGLRMVPDKKWETLFGIAARKPDGELLPSHCNLGLAIQKVTEEIMLKMAATAQKLTGSKNLCMAGGVALNCVANGKLLNEELFDNIFIQPAAGDAGGALGAALAAWHIYFGREPIKTNGGDHMKGAYLGPELSDLDIKLMALRYNAPYEYFDDFNTLADKTASLLAEGNVIGWIQGKMEFGPRALGARSILGDARNADMQKKLNLKIKYRESFRPFAPSVLCEDRERYFDLKTDSPYMLMVEPVASQHLRKLPDDYNLLSIRDKLYTDRSSLPAVTHVDLSARIQTVHRETNPRYWQLIRAFKQQTGCAVIANTSFNVRGEPIVCTPEDAYRCFMRTEMDYLVAGNYLFSKTAQPQWQEKASWKEEFILD